MRATLPAEPGLSYRPKGVMTRGYAARGGEGGPARAALLTPRSSARRDEAEQAVRLTSRPRDEVESRGGTGSPTVAEGDRPEPRYLDQPSVGGAELSLVRPPAPHGLLVRADLAVSEVADQQVAAEGAEA